MRTNSEAYIKARKYVNNIKNDSKAAYASEYLFYLVGWNSEPEIPRGLSHITGQAVRMRLAEIERANPS